MWNFARRTHTEIQKKMVFYVILSTYLTVHKLETAQNIFNVHSINMCIKDCYDISHTRKNRQDSQNLFPLRFFHSEGWKYRRPTPLCLSKQYHISKCRPMYCVRSKATNFYTAETNETFKSTIKGQGGSRYRTDEYLMIEVRSTRLQTTTGGTEIF